MIKQTDKLEFDEEAIYMKKVLMGGFISLIGSIWALAIIFIAGNNLVPSWVTPPGRFLTTVMEMELMFLFILSVLLVVTGIIIMVVGLFQKEN